MDCLSRSKRYIKCDLFSRNYPFISNDCTFRHSVSDLVGGVVRLRALSGCAGFGTTTNCCDLPVPTTCHELAAPAATSTERGVGARGPSANVSVDPTVKGVAWESKDTITHVQFLDALSGPEISGTFPALDTLPTPKKLSLREAIDTALLRNPDAVTARASGPVIDASRVVAATYPWNPSVQVQVDPYARDIDGNFLDTKNQVSVMQTLELAHQGRYRRQGANATWNHDRAIIAQGEWTAVVATMCAYFDVLYRKGAARPGHERRRNAGSDDWRYGSSL